MNYSKEEILKAIQSLQDRSKTVRSLALEETNADLRSRFETNALDYQKRINELTEMLENMEKMLG